MADQDTKKTISSRRGILAMLAGGVLLFFAIYYIVLRDFNIQSRNEIASRLRNVNAGIETLEEKAADTAWWVASRPDVIQAVEKRDVAALRKICAEVMVRTRMSTVAITDTNGIVIAQENSSIADTDTSKLVVTQKALSGKPASGLEEDPVLELTLRAACPIKADHAVNGAVITGMNLFSDHSFVDGTIKNFGLVCSVFHNDVRISTTIYKEGKRALGTKLNNSRIREQVLENGGIFEGRNKAVDKEYDTAYWPLRNTSGRIVGVVGIGKDRETLTRIFAITAIVAVLIIGCIAILITRKSFRLQSLILLIIVPSMILITAGASWLLYRNLYAIILDGFNAKLSALSTTTASCLDGDILRKLLDKHDAADPAFTKYMKTLREIQKQKEITYLYTFVLGGKKDIVYIIDASPGDDFCPVGYEENIPMQNMEGLRRTVSEGVPYISDIQEYERYGLMKVSAAPVYGGTNIVQALAGVDINISVIKKKLRMAISNILGAGVFALVLAGLASFWFSKKIIQPLTSVKSGALLLAAGEYGHRITVSDPLELEALASAFNRVGNTIGGILQKAAQNNDNTETDRRRSELAKEMAETAGNVSSSRTCLLNLCWLGGRSDCANSSGAVADNNLALAWIADSPADPLKAIKTRRDIAVISLQLLRKYNDDQESIITILRTLFKDTISAFILFDAASGALHLLVRRPITAFLPDASGSIRNTGLSNDRQITIQPGASLALTSQVPLESLTALPSALNMLSLESSIQKSAAPGTGALSKALLITLQRRIQT